MIVGTPSLWPVKETLGLVNAKVVDTGVAMLIKPFTVEFPVFVPIRAVTLTGIVVPLISKADGN